jgi:stress response protein SCP2
VNGALRLAEFGSKRQLIIMGSSESKAAKAAPETQPASHNSTAAPTGRPSQEVTRSNQPCAIIASADGQTRKVPATATLRLALAWDDGAKPVDVDLQCCVFDSLGLLLDACFFNNKNALEGALQLSGDSHSGEASGADESITINLAGLPPHAAGIVAGAFCTAGGELTAAHHVTVTVDDVASNDQLARASVNTTESATGALVFVLQRTGMNEWQVAAHTRVFRGVRSFVDALDQMQSLLSIPEELKREFKSQQPVYNLKKNESKPLPLGLSEVAFGLGWDAGCDVDASVVALTQNGSVTEQAYFGNKIACDGAIRHSGDNTTGEGAGDDETIQLNLMELKSRWTHCFVCVNVYSAGKDFNDVKNESVRIYDRTTGQTLMRYGALDGHGSSNGVVLGCLYRDRALPQRWVFKAISLGAEGKTCKDLIDECQVLQRSL